MNYADLEIRILQKDANGYPVEITFNGEQEFPRGLLTPDLPPPTPSETYGQRLFAWLFSSDALKKAWANARGQQPNRRIRLRIDEGAPGLHAIPWEMLQDTNDGGIPLDLCATDATPFSRYIAGAWVPGSPILKRPIRVLVAVANPEGLDDLDLAVIDPELELNTLNEATAENKNIELVQLDGPCTLEAIEAALRTGFHILHFIGHGEFKAGAAHLLLCNAEKKNEVLSVKDTDIAAMLGRQLADAGANTDDKLRLVYLSSCQTAMRSPADAFRGLAPRLIAAGVPAVIAMQDNIPVATATKFSQTFYSELVKHGQVDRAANNARSSVITSRLPGAAIPVLFMRLRSGQLFGQRGVVHSSLGEGFWQALFTKIAAKRCIPFIGPGVTNHLLPSKQELARQLAASYKYPFPDIESLPRVTQFIGSIDYMEPRDQVVSRLVAQFRKRMGDAAGPKRMDQTLSEAISAAKWGTLSRTLFEDEIHRQLAGLDLPLYLTTNFDNFMTEALQARLDENQKGKVRREVVPWREKSLDQRNLEPAPTPEAPAVLHLFGTDADLESIVLSEDDHLDYLARISRDNEHFLPENVNSLLARSTLLFLGYGLEDLDFKIITRGLLANIDMKRWGALKVAVQLESSQPDAAKEKEVVEYFKRYFSESKIEIYWGTTLQFMTDLSSRWKEYRNA